MDTYDWRTVHTEFEQRMIHSITGYVERSDIDIAPIDRALRQGLRESSIGYLTSTLESTWRSLSPRPELAGLFATFLYVRCQLTWEMSIGHSQITAVITAISQSWGRVGHLFDPATQLTVDIVVRHTESLISCMAAENALQCSCPIDLGLQSSRVADDSARQIERSNELLDTEWKEFTTEFLHPVLRAHQLTFDSIRQAANAVLAWAERAPGTVTLLRQAAAALEHSERHEAVVHDVYAGELRAYRAGLTALLSYIEDTRIPDVRFDDAQIIYIYPFTLPGIDGPEACRLAADFAPDALGKARIIRSSETLMTDVWTRHGRQKSEYGGVTVTLPNLTIRTTSGEFLEHQVEIRLSKLGNHYVRVFRCLRDATLHDLNQALRRVSSDMGAEAVSERHTIGQVWEKLPDYATHITDCLIGALRSAAGHIDTADPSDHPPAHSAIDVYMHALLEIKAVSIVNNGVAERTARTEEILRAADALFRTPVQYLSTALEEWVTRANANASANEAMPNLLRETLGPSQFIGSTLNSTVIVMPDTPHWVMLQYEEQIEFTESLPPLVEQWRNSLSHAVANDSRDLPELSSTALARKRFELQALVADIRNQLAVLNSIDLCGTLANRRFLDDLYQAAGLPDLYAELTATISRVESTYEQMTSLISQRDEHRNRRYQVVVEVILAILAVASLAEVLSLANDSLDLDGSLVVWWELGGLAAIAVITALIILVLFKLRDD